MVLVNLDGFLPGHLLLIVDLAQVSRVEHMPPDHFVTGASFIFDNAPKAVFLSALQAFAAAEKRDSAK